MHEDISQGWHFAKTYCMYNNTPVKIYTPNREKVVIHMLDGG